MRRASTVPSIFKDDFDGPRPTAEPLFDDRWMTFMRQDGVGRVTTSLPGVMPVVYSESQFEDFLLDVEVPLRKEGRQVDCGILFRSKRQGNELPGYNCVLVSPAKGAIIVGRWDMNRWASWRIFPWKFAGDHSMFVRLEVMGDKCRVFINQTFALEARGQLILGPGLLCLALLGSGEGAQSVDFRRLRVYQTVP